MGLFSSHYFSLFHQTLVYTHVLTAILSLIVAPIAMYVQKGGQAHRRWGKAYFWGMVVANCSAFVLLTYRFNVFLLGVTIISLYGALVGYRVLYRKQTDPVTNPIDWAIVLVTFASGVMLIIWSVAAYFGTTLAGPPLGNDAPMVIILLPLGFGLMIVSGTVGDIRNFLRPRTDKNWWWFEHMNAMLSSYIGLTTALMVQQVGPHMPDNIAWIVWVLPAVIGSVGISKWIGHYRRKFAGVKNQEARPQTA